MHTHKELLALVSAGVRPIITFTQACLEMECYCEPGMKAVVLSGAENQLDVLRIMVDYAPFEAHNTMLESANYFGKNGASGLTAREANQYQPQEDLYLDLSGHNPTCVSIDTQAKVQLFSRYQAETASLTSYVGWLEDEVLRFTGKSA
jgi:hypothetical protein